MKSLHKQTPKVVQVKRREAFVQTKAKEVHNTNLKFSDDADNQHTSAKEEPLALTWLQKRRLSKQARLSWGTRLLHWSRLWNPVEWWRFARFRRLPIDWHALLDAACGILIPILIYYTTRASLRLTQNLPVTFLPPLTNVSVPHLAVPYCCSPWTFHYLHRGTRPFSQLAQAAQSRALVRSKTLPEASECLGEAIQEGRAYRTKLYDVYLPPPSRCAKTNHDAILFLPGIGVEHTSYAISARMLSEYGHVVVVVSGEPWRVVNHQWRYTPEFVSRRIMKRVERRHGVKSWNVLGHSLGAFTATHLAPSLDPRHCVSKVAMWGVAHFLDSLNDLSNYTNISVLVVQGSNDAVIRAFGSATSSKDFWKLLPRSRTSQEQANVVIPEGTHSGFASYMSSQPQFCEHSNKTFEQKWLSAEITHKFFNNVALASSNE